MLRDATVQVFKRVTLDDLDQVAGQSLEHSGDCRVWLLSGEMGAGKTTFIKAVCRNLGVADPMSSPTFSIVNEYETRDGQSVYHFDFFRLKDEREALDIGAEEYFDSGNYCFIEWPDRVAGLIPDVHAHVRITTENETHRTIALSVHDGKEKNRI